jgi:hypothetical protein
VVVLLTNLTDAPGSKHHPTQLDIHNRTLSPGEQLRLPAELVGKRERALETEGFIAIGALPSWYTAAKTRKGRRLSEEEKEKLIVRPKPAPAEKKSKVVPITKPDSTPVQEPHELAPQDIKELNRTR